MFVCPMGISEIFFDEQIIARITEHFEQLSIKVLQYYSITAMDQDDSGHISKVIIEDVATEDIAQAQSLKKRKKSMEIPCNLFINCCVKDTYVIRVS